MSPELAQRLPRSPHSGWNALSSGTPSGRRKISPARGGCRTPGTGDSYAGGNGNGRRGTIATVSILTRRAPARLELLAWLACRPAAGTDDGRNYMEFLKNVVEKRGVRNCGWRAKTAKAWLRRVEPLKLVENRLTRPPNSSACTGARKPKKAEHTSARLVELPGPSGKATSLRPKARNSVRRFQQWYEDVELFATPPPCRKIDNDDSLPEQFIIHWSINRYSLNNQSIFSQKKNFFTCEKAA